MTSLRRPAAVLAAVLALAACSLGGAPSQGTASRSSGSTSTASGGTGATSTAVPSPTPTGECPGERCLTLAVTGDVLLHPPLWKQAHRDAGGRGYDFGPLLAGQRPYVEPADLAVCHLETPLATSAGPFRGYPSFDVPPQVATALRHTGYDACTTASNHSLDDGTSGVDRTLRTLESAGLRHAGSARSKAEASHPTLLRSHGTTLALLAYSYGLNGRALPAGQPWRVNLIDVPRVLRDAHAARAAGADLVVVALHWGVEYHAQPTSEQSSIARRLLADPDIDLVYGHHAHVVQPIQRVEGKWVLYGLGNAVAAHGQGDPANRRGLLVQVRFVRRAGRWSADPPRWVASYVDGPTYRWVDLSATTSGGLSPATRRTYEAAHTAVRRVVESLGARGQGAREERP